MKDLIIDHPIGIVVGCMMLLAAAGLALPGLGNDPNPELLPPEHHTRVTHEQLKATYTGNRDVVVVMLEHDESVFNPATLTRIPQLSAAFKDLTVVQPGDEQFLASLHAMLPRDQQAAYADLLNQAHHRSTGALALEARTQLQSTDQWSPALETGLNRYLDHLYPVVKIHSLSDTDNIIADAGDLIVKPIYADVPSTADELAALRDEVAANELFEGLLVGNDGRSAGMYLELALAVEDAAAAQALLEKINGAVADHPGAERVYVAGMPVTTSTISKAIDADMGLLFPIVLLVMLVILRLSFGDMKGIGLPIVVVVTSLVVTLGVMAAAGVDLNIITASLPVFIISIGIADGVHFYSEYRTQYHLYGEKREAVARTLALLAKPIALTSITTALAFWSLTFTEIVQIAWFGVFVALGTMLAMVFSLLLLPALAMLLPPPAIGSLEDADKPGVNRLVEATVHWISHATARRPLAITVVMLGVFLAALYGAKDASFDNNRVKFFSSTSDLVVSVDRIRSALAGSEVLNIDLKASDGDAEPFKSAGILSFIDALEQFALTQQNVGASVSLAKLVRRMNLVVHDNDPAYNTIPAPTGSGPEAERQVDRLISQYLFLYENGGGDLLSDVVDSQFTSSNLKLYLRTNSSTDIAALMGTLQNYLDVNLPAGIEASFAGNGRLLVAAGDEIILGQMRSLTVCVFIVAVLLVIQFRSFAQGLLGFVPLALAVTVNFGLLGYLGIDIDIGTAIVSSVAIGIGVDYSIHYICRFNHLQALGYSRDDAIGGAVVRAGKAITCNALVVGVGFLVLLASGFVPISTIGWLVSLSLAISCIATLVLIPSLLRLTTGSAPARFMAHQQSN